MIGIIGTADDIIGFGLAGVGKAQELSADASAERVRAAIEALRSEVEALIIAEDLLDRVRGDRMLAGLLIIEIPKSEDREDDISLLAKELLGVTLE